MILIIIILVLLLILLFFRNSKTISVNNTNRVSKNIKLPDTETISKTSDNSIKPWCINGISYVFDINGVKSNSVSVSKSETQTYPMITLTNIKNDITSSLTVSDKITLTKTIGSNTPITIELKVGEKTTDNKYEITKEGVFVDYENHCNFLAVVPVVPVAPVNDICVKETGVGYICKNVPTGYKGVCGYVRKTNDMRCCKNGTEYVPGGADYFCKKEVENKQECKWDVECKSGACGEIRDASGEKTNKRCCTNGSTSSILNGDYFCMREQDTGAKCRWDDECKNGNCKGNWSGSTVGRCN